MNVTRTTFDDVMVPNYNPADMVPVRGEGSRVWDQRAQPCLLANRHLHSCTNLSLTAHISL